MLRSVSLGLGALLRDRTRRKEFFRRFTQDEIAMQIRDWRKQRGLTQAALAKLTGMKQSAVSRVEKADYAAWNFATLVRVAEALDGRWKITFVPSEDAIKYFAEMDNPDVVSSRAGGGYEVKPPTGVFTVINHWRTELRA
jgi:transcriptional regulator with XRE-family HTH domain